MDKEWWVNESDLDDQQRRVIGLGAEGRHLLIGPPGSGKTNLLLLRANYLSSGDKPNLLILVFTRPLREFIASGASRYLFPANKVQTYNRWARRLLRDEGIDLPESEDFEEERHNLLEGLRRLVEREAITDEYYDAILLDEAHDYLTEEIEIIRAFTRNMFSTADSRQQIYRRDPGAIELLMSISETIELPFHYRNGIQICKLADRIMKGRALYSHLEPSSRYNEADRPSSVERFECSDFEQECNIMIGKLETQLQAYPRELLGVICPRREEFYLVRDYLSNSSVSELCVFQDSEHGYSSFDDDHPICVSTVHGAKGLEFAAVHLLACETFYGFPRTNRNMTFTAVTRAKTSFCLYYAESIYPYLQSALAALFPRPEPPTIRDAFGRSR